MYWSYHAKLVSSGMKNMGVMGFLICHIGGRIGISCGIGISHGIGISCGIGLVRGIRSIMQNLSLLA